MLQLSRQGQARTVQLIFRCIHHLIYTTTSRACRLLSDVKRSSMLVMTQDLASSLRPGDNIIAI